MLSKLRVFTGLALLPEVEIVLPCIGSHSHTTLQPSAITARSSGGSFRSTCVRAHAADQRQPPRLVRGFSVSDQPQQVRDLGRSAPP